MNISGQKFGRLLAISRDDRYGSRWPRWLCRCDCGNTVIVRQTDLRSKNTQSCGCLTREPYPRGGLWRYSECIKIARDYPPSLMRS